MFILEYFSLATLCCFLGLGGIFSEKSSIVFFICYLEVFYVGVNMLLLAHSYLWGTNLGYSFVLYILVLTALETSLGLMLIYLNSRMATRTLFAGFKRLGE